MADTFRDEFINGKIFIHLGKQDLNDLGIFQFQRRKALFDHIQALRLKQELHGSSEVFTFSPSRSQSVHNQPAPRSFASFLDDELDALHLNYSSLDLSGDTVPTDGSHGTDPSTVGRDRSLDVSVSSDFSTFPVSNLGYSKATKSLKSMAVTGPDPNQMPIAMAVHDLKPTVTMSPKQMVSDILQISKPSSPTVSTDSVAVEVAETVTTPNQDQQGQSGQTQFSGAGKWKNVLLSNGSDQSSAARLKLKTAPIVMNTVSVSRGTTGGIPTESYGDNVVPHFVASQNVVKFMAVFRGINVAKFVYLLMDQSQIKQLDAIVARRGRKSLKPAEWISMGQRGGSKIQRSFHSKLDIKYVSDGWLLDSERGPSICRFSSGRSSPGTVHMPFNPICVFTLDLNRNEVVSMNALSVAGYVHNVRAGAMWITSSLRVLATEKRKASDQPDKCGDIAGLEFQDNRKGHLDALKVSYMVQDHVYHQHKNRALQSERVRIRCCLKLSTRTNKRVGGVHRQVYIQSWNVRPASKRRSKIN